jgi:hypothetical protein
MLSLFLVVAAQLVPFNSADSITRLERSKAKTDFFALVNHYEGQINAGMCGPASGVIVLNALRVDNSAITKPTDQSTVPAEFLAGIPKGIDPFFKRYTQRAFFDDKFESVKPKAVFHGAPNKDGKRDPGMQLRQLGDVLKAHGLDVQVRVLDDKLTDADAKKEIIANLARAADFVIINYTRVPLGQKGGGHISPLGAYDEASDSFLVLDVNPNDGKTWVWIPSAQLLGAMRTKDTIENCGYLLVKEGTK